jgi:AcrR family transcriptional regulator
VAEEAVADWQRRVVGRSLNDARRRSLDRGARLVRAAATVLERNGGASLTVQEVADEAGQSLRTLYQYFESKDDLLLAVFEEAMQTYARIIRDAIAELDDPVERLAGGLIASARAAAVHQKAGRDRGLSRLRLQLSQADPELLARSQAPLTELFSELVQGAAADGAFAADSATYFLMSLRASFVLSSTLGNDLDVELPDVIDFSWFCLAGLGLQRPRTWHVDVERRLQFKR